MMDLFDLNGKTALITGASQGLGERFAHILSCANSKVILAARQLGKLENIAEAIRRKGGKVVCVKMDVSDNASVQHCIDQLTRDGETIDILINNAGISYMTPVFDDANSEKGHFESMMQTNVMGIWYVIKAIAKHMKDKDINGSIVNIASVCGANRLRSNLTGYCASKAAVIQMTKALVGELSTVNIRINCIAPGLIHTPLNNDRIGEPEIRKSIERTIPVNFVADPCELDGAILYLASNKASRYTTGACLTVDGGASWGGVYDAYIFKGVVY